MNRAALMTAAWFVFFFRFVIIILFAVVTYRNCLNLTNCFELSKDNPLDNLRPWKKCGILYGMPEVKKNRKSHGFIEYIDKNGKVCVCRR